MFNPWGFGATSNVLLEQWGREAARLRGRFDGLTQALLILDPPQVGPTPADVVYSEGNLRLLHYRSTTAQVQPVPLLVVPSVLYRPFMLDLQPGASLVEYLVGRGLDVYLLDWGLPAPTDRRVSFDQYLTGYLRRAVQQVGQQTGQTEISLLGYSLGGTFAAIFGALYGQYVRNLVAVAAPINFHDDGVLSQWTRLPNFNVDLVADTLSALPLPLMQASFRLLRPTGLVLQQLALAECWGDFDAVEDYLALQLWLGDTTPWLGEAFRTYIKECYQANHLVQGKLVVGGRRVVLNELQAALLTVTAANDQLCPPRSAAVLNALVGSADKQVLELQGGHVSSVVGRRAPSRFWPRLGDWLVERSST